jgi:hypothetical protein
LRDSGAASSSGSINVVYIEVLLLRPLRADKTFSVLCRCRYNHHGNT